MPIVDIFSGTFCNKNSFIQAIHESMAGKLYTDKEVVAEAGRISGLPESKIERSFSAKTSVFNKFTHERERSIAYLRLAISQLLLDDGIVIAGYAGMLIPERIGHVLRVCLISAMKNRISFAARELNISEEEATKLIHNQDEKRAIWVHELYNVKDPWDAGLFDMVIPTDKTDIDKAVSLVKDALTGEALAVSDQSKKEVLNFRLAAAVEVALVMEGHNVDVDAFDGKVILTINKHVLMLSRLEAELKTIAEKVPGVRAVETKVGPDFHQTDIYRKYDFETPSKILLVDDEREFVQTLSERLLMRDMGSAVTYDGASALEMAREEEPDVMILDLKMPGIDGIEVLRKVKETQPEIEVIILTGHGSETDKKVCMDLGAFAYLRKPVDINALSETIRKANEKIRLKKIENTGN